MQAKIQHTNSMVLLIVYAGRKILLTGDSDWKSWKEKIVPNFSKYSINYENTDILVASHHGSRSFFTDEANEHQEIYYKSDDEKTERILFSRDLAYGGTHLLRCRIKNTKKNFDETKIFVVKGTKNSN